MEIRGSRRIGRLLDRTLRLPPRDLDPLACLLPDRPDGDRGVLAQLLDVPGDLGTLIGGMVTLTVGVGVQAVLPNAVTTVGTFPLSKGVMRKRSPCCLTSDRGGTPWQLSCGYGYPPPCPRTCSMLRFMT